MTTARTLRSNHPGRAARGRVRLGRPGDSPEDASSGQYATAFFGTWTVIGLFVDGWAHQVDKPESFFTPWHLLLYSGFAGGVTWFVLRGLRSQAHSLLAAFPEDRLALLGFVMFAGSGVGDGIWHEVFGVEVGLEALLSPTHLLLMIGGLLMLSAPVRWALSSRVPVGGRHFVPVVAGLTLCASLTTFFTMYLASHTPLMVSAANDLELSYGVASLLVRNLLLMGPVLFAVHRLSPPVGTCSVVFTANAVLMAGLEGFEYSALVVPFLIGGVVGDLLLARGAGARVLALVTPLALWSGYVGVHAAVWGIGWSVELWSGAIFLSVASAWGLEALLRATPAPAGPTPRPLTV